MLERVTVIGGTDGRSLLDGVGRNRQKASLINDSLGAGWVEVSHASGEERLCLHVCGSGLLDLVVERSLDRLLLGTCSVLLD